MEFAELYNSAQPALIYLIPGKPPTMLLLCYYVPIVLPAHMTSYLGRTLEGAS